MDTATNSVADPTTSDTVTEPAAVDPLAATPPAGNPVVGDVPADSPVAEQSTGDPAATEPPAAAAPKTPNLTARLAALSKEKREAQKQAKAAQAAKEALEARLQPVDKLLARAQSGDMTVIPELFKLTGLDFRKIVEFHAGQGEQPEADPVSELKNEIAELKKAREDETKAAQQRAQEASRAEMLGSIRTAIKANAEKFEICDRLGDEAAADVFAEVAEAWNKAGRPQLEPGEFDEAVLAAIEIQEGRYEERGKKLAKKAKAAAAQPAATQAETDLPAGLTASDSISDKDADILKGLIDKTAPATNSPRAKPRTIGRDMGGSAPPRVAPTGDRDPREALRDLIAPFVQSAAS